MWWIPDDPITITVIENETFKSVEEVLKPFATADPDWKRDWGDPAILSLEEKLTFSEMGDLTPQFICGAFREGPLWIAIEVNGWMGVSPLVQKALTKSSPTARAMSAYWNVNGVTGFLYSMGGETVAEFVDDMCVSTLKDEFLKKPFLWKNEWAQDFNDEKLCESMIRVIQRAFEIEVEKDWFENKKMNYIRNFFTY